MEAGPGKAITNIVNIIKKEITDHQPDKQKRSCLGSIDFKKEYETEFAYAVGRLGYGISSAAMMRTLNDAGILGFLGLQYRRNDKEQLYKYVKNAGCKIAVLG